MNRPVALKGAASAVSSLTQHGVGGSLVEEAGVPAWQLTQPCCVSLVSSVKQVQRHGAVTIRRAHALVLGVALAPLWLPRILVRGPESSRPGRTSSVVHSSTDTIH